MLAKTIYNAKTLLGMLDMAIDAMIESGQCTYCRLYPSKDERCSKIDLCRNFIFEGLLRLYRLNKK